MRRQEERFLSDSDVFRVGLWRENVSALGLGTSQHVPMSLKLSSGEKNFTLIEAINLGSDFAGSK